MTGATLVIPCYNEAARLDEAAFLGLVGARPGLRLLFVNDGSTDATEERLRAVAARRPDRIGVLSLAANGGKAEAVRRGMCTAFKSSAEHVGYWDADLATPLDEIPRFTSLLAARPHVELVMGARVQLLGRRVRRSPVRHYLGRVFATAVSQVLHLPVYDTQCGAKLLRNRPELAVLFEAPFCVNWTFDVELLARFLAAGRGAGALYELPLECWEDVAGSRVRATDFFVAFVEVARIWSRYGGALS